MDALSAFSKFELCFTSALYYPHHMANFGRLSVKDSPLRKCCHVAAMTFCLMYNDEHQGR